MKKIKGIILLMLFLGMLVTPSVSWAFTIEELQSQINNLLAMALSLQQQLKEQTTSLENNQVGNSSSGLSDNGDGTVTDSSTGLVWLKNANCFGSVNWDEAKTKASQLKNGQCGLSDGSTAGQWRLPTINKLG